MSEITHSFKRKMYAEIRVLTLFRRNCSYNDILSSKYNHIYHDFPNIQTGARRQYVLKHIYIFITIFNSLCK